MRLKIFNQKKADADCDGGIRKIEDRPDPEIEKIDHRTDSKAVDQIAHGPAQDKADSPLNRGPGRTGPESDGSQDPDAEKDHHQKDFFGVREKTKSDARIFNQGEMEPWAQDRDAFARMEEGLGDCLGELIEEHHEAGRDKEDPSRDYLRFFFSSSS